MMFLNLICFWHFIKDINLPLSLPFPRGEITRGKFEINLNKPVPANAQQHFSLGRIANLIWPEVTTIFKTNAIVRFWVHVNWTSWDRSQILKLLSLKECKRSRTKPINCFKFIKTVNHWLLILMAIYTDSKLWIIFWTGNWQGTKEEGPTALMSGLLMFIINGANLKEIHKKCLQMKHPSLKHESNRVFWEVPACPGYLCVTLHIPAGFVLISQWIQAVWL